MKRVDFTRPGGFPLEQETFALLQEAYRDEFFTAFKEHLGVKSDENYILSHATADLRGWVIVSGILVSITPRTSISTSIKVTVTRKALVFGTGIKEKVYITYEAEYVDSVPTDVEQPPETEDESKTISYFELNTFKQITNIPDLSGKFLPLNGSSAMQGDLNLGSHQISKLDSNDVFSAYVRSADFNLGYSGRRGQIYPDRPWGRALVDGGDTLSLNYSSDWEKTQIFGDINLPNLGPSQGEGGTPLLVDQNGNLSRGSITFRGSVPLGLIALWSESTIPDGWILCDGNQGVKVNGFTIPNLTGQFVTGTKYIMYVGDFNQLPVAMAGSDITVQLPTNKATLNGSAQDPDGTISSYAWSKRSGGTATIVSPSSAKTEITGLVAGTYIFRLTVRDNGGATTFDEVRIIVKSANRSPIISNISGTTAVSYSSGSASTVLTATASDPDNDPISYRWTKTSGPGSQSLSGTSTSRFTASGMINGTYKFLLEVTDNKGAKTQRTTTVRVTQRPSIRILSSGSGSNRLYTIRVSGAPNSNVSIVGTLTRKDSGGSMVINGATLLNVGNVRTFNVRLNSSGISDFTSRISASTSSFNITVYTRGSISIGGQTELGSSVGISASYRRSSGGGGGGGGCFSLDSKVLLANGASKLLKNVNIGDKLLGFDFVNRIDASSGDYFDWEGNLKEAYPIEVTVKDMTTLIADSYFEIVLSDQSILKVTQGHPLLSANNSENNTVAWVKPTYLDEGMRLVDKNGNLVEIDTITLIHQKLEVGVLDVETIDNYIISDVVVHNAELQRLDERIDIIKE